MDQGAGAERFYDKNLFTVMSKDEAMAAPRLGVISSGGQGVFERKAPEDWTHSKTLTRGRMLHNVRKVLMFGT